MTLEPLQNSQQLEDLRRQLSESQALVDRLLDCQEAHLREINNLNTAQQSAAQRAEHWQDLAAKSHSTASKLLAERDALIGVLAESRKFCGLSTKNYFEVLKQREALQAELSSLKADMFVLNNDMGYTTGVLEDVLNQRDALQAECEALRKGHDKTHQMIDRALAVLQNIKMISEIPQTIKKAIEILTGEGENA